MRVTDRMIQNQVISSISDGQEKILEIQKQISSNKEVSKASDDPTRFDRAGRFKTLLSKNEQYQDNIDDGMGWSLAGTDALTVLYESLDQVKVEGMRSRADLDPNEKIQTGKLVTALLEEMLIMANMSHGGKNLFGGTITKGADPFSIDGSTVTYNGNDEDILRRVGVDTFAAVNIVGSKFISVLESTVAMRDALAANDGPGMDVALAEIETAAVDLLNAITEGGAVQRKMELISDNLGMARINLESYISQAEDVDLAEAILEYNSKELGYRAALESSSRILKITILDYLR